MTNGGIIEGHTEYSGCNDLSSAIGYAGRWIDISSPVFLRTSGRLDGSGATLRAVSLRKPAIEKEARLRPQHFTLFGCCLGNTKGNAAACVLAGHHHSPSRNRIKAGHFTFGSVEFCMQMRVVSGGIKGPSEICATSLPITL
jgi:hypothetical protein